MSQDFRCVRLVPTQAGHLQGRRPHHTLLEGKMFASVIEQLEKAESELKPDLLLYRGHSDADWPLLPGLARSGASKSIEQILYYDFITRAGSLLSANCSSWSKIFCMQHHGLLTRLLDWTSTFGVALHFAMKGCSRESAIWILDPFELNKKCWGEELLPSPEELESDYYNAYIGETKDIAGTAVAISPSRENPRVFNQKAAFTLHTDLTAPLEILCPSAVKKIVIPDSARADASKFLKLAGISEFSLFPDLDGLARDLLAEHFGCS